MYRAKVIAAQCVAAARTSREGAPRLSVVVAKTRSNVVFAPLQHLVSNRKTRICIYMTAALHMCSSAIAASRLRHHVCDSRMQPRVLLLFPLRSASKKAAISPSQVIAGTKGSTGHLQFSVGTSAATWHRLSYSVDEGFNGPGYGYCHNRFLARISVDNSEQLRLCHDSLRNATGLAGVRSKLMSRLCVSRLCFGCAWQ
jgi:hypothetical protein